MKATKNQTKQNSSKIHSKLREAAFVPLSSEDSDRFIYKKDTYVNRDITKKWLNLKRKVNSILQKPIRWASFVDWKKAKDDLAIWSVETFLEGLTANFATHYLFGLKFNFMMIIAHGILIWQGLSIYWRLKKYGEYTKIPKKDE